MEKKQYAEWVVSNNERPDKEGFYYAEDSKGQRTMVHFYDEHWHSLTGRPVNKWLRDISGILLSVERYEALMKCVELLQDINDGDATSPYSSNYIGSKYSDRIDKTLQTLKQTNNED